MFLQAVSKVVFVHTVNGHQAVNKNGDNAGSNFKMLISYTICSVKQVIVCIEKASQVSLPQAIHKPTKYAEQALTQVTSGPHLIFWILLPFKQH